MITRRQANAGILASATTAAPALAAAEQAKAITLPPPRKDGGEPLQETPLLRPTSMRKHGRFA